MTTHETAHPILVFGSARWVCARFARTAPIGAVGPKDREKRRTASRIGANGCECRFGRAARVARLSAREPHTEPHTVCVEVS